MKLLFELIEITENSEYFKIKMFDKLYGKKIHPMHLYTKLTDNHFNAIIHKLNENKTYTGSGIFKVILKIKDHTSERVITSIIKIVEIGFGKMSVHRYENVSFLKLDCGIVLKYNQYL
jgi:hypothetical protein